MQTKTKLKAFRESTGVLAKDIAANPAVYLTRPEYSTIENGKVLPRADALLAMCEMMGGTPLDMFDKDEIDLMAVQRKLEARIPAKSPVTRFDTLPPGNPRIAVRLKQEEIEAVESAVHILGYKSFGQYFRRVVKPMLERQVRERVDKGEVSA